MSKDSPTVRTGSSPRLRIGDLEAPVGLPNPSDRIDSFELEEAIGVGGMGAVFRALDGKLDRHVALKILPPEQANDSEVVQRFYQEGRAAARLDHENIARVYTIGQDSRYHYIAFEYIEGTTIRQRVERNGPLSIAEAINFTLQIAGALVHAAERGVVHRDIKPSNIIVTPQGRAKLVDMGLARRFERGCDDGLTQSGMTLGTFDYISPEQARDPRDVDVRSDLYSLGCTLFHMLTGRPPFPEGTVLQKLLQHQEDAPPDVRSLNPEVPPDLATILVKLMAKDRDRRYQTPEQLVRDLLTVAGALGLRSLSPEGLVWMSAARPPGWERHLVWSIPTLAFVAVVAVLVWWEQETITTPPRPGGEPLTKVTEPSEASRPVEGPPRVVAASPTGSVDVIPAPAVDSPSAVARDIVVASTDDLLSELAAAPPRSVVILSDDGPYLLGGGADDRTATPLVRRDLIIRADAGVRPVLQLARGAAARHKGSGAVLDFSGGRVTIEGVEFVLDPGDREDDLDALRTEETELTVRRCVFRRSGSRVRRGREAAIQVRSSRADSDRPVVVMAEACHFDAGQVGVLAIGPGDIVLRDCTMAGAEPAVWLDNRSSPTVVPVDLRLRHVSLVAGENPVFRFEGSAPRIWADDIAVAPAREISGTLVAIDDPDALQWRGRGNGYGRIGVFLAYVGPERGREPVRDWASWEDGFRFPEIRESGSASTRDPFWAEADLVQALDQAREHPTRAFRLSATHPGAPDLGVRQGPFDTLAPVIRVAANLPDARREPLRSEAATPSPAAGATSRPNATPPAEVPPPDPSAKARTGDEMPEMPEMPVMPPTDRDTPSPRTTTTVAAADGRPAEENRNDANTVRAERPEPDAGVLRTGEQLLRALNQPGAPGGVLRIAADANWDLPGARIQGNARWTLRAEPGVTRPKIRFHPSPADPKAPTLWSVWLEVRSGVLQIEGIDILLADADAPREGRWAAFSVWGGADLSLTNCTVTVEGDDVVSAVVAVPAAESAAGLAAEGAEPLAAVVRMSDSLIRSGRDLVEVAAGRRLELELNNAVVSTSGCLVHAHGVPRGQAAETVRLTLNQVTARTAGGLVQLESALGEPDLPIADVRVRDSILATTPEVDPEHPLFRVDGQDGLATLRDRIRWEGHGVAYHQIRAYRRDQSAQVGAVPNRYDRPSWQVAVGTKEEDSLHGDVKFVRTWDGDQPPWALRPDDVRLAPDSPAQRAGADLSRIPGASTTPN